MIYRCCLLYALFLFASGTATLHGVDKNEIYYLKTTSTSSHTPRDMTTDDQAPTNSASPTTTSCHVVLRLFLVRHGETDANIQGLVVGQSNPLLTDRGRKQAWALGQSSDWTLGPSQFWRVYSSDLMRAQQTTQILLESFESKVDPIDSSRTYSDDHNHDNTCTRNRVQWDSRLRELAKGARQGFPKAWTYQRALDERRRQLQEGISAEPIPLLETEEEGETRIMEWLYELANQAMNEHQADLALGGDVNSAPNETRQNRFTVLAVAHSNILRIFLLRLLGIDNLRAHPDAVFDSNDGRFLIPNTSLTILDVHVARKHPATNPDRLNPKRSEERSSSTITGIDIVLLTSTKHYNLLEKDQVQQYSRSNELFQEQS